MSEYGHAISTGSVSATEIAIGATQLDDALHLIHQAAARLSHAPHIAADLFSRTLNVCADLSRIRDDARRAVPGSTITPRCAPLYGSDAVRDLLLTSQQPTTNSAPISK